MFIFQEGGGREKSLLSDPGSEFLLGRERKKQGDDNN